MTNTYSTGNPIGSMSPKDLYDNASNLDDLMLGPVPSYPDRLGKQRQSWSGIEKLVADFLQNMGFEATHLTYVDGSPLIVLRPTQLIDRAGMTYKIRTPATFPFTLTGTFATDAPNLIDVGDAALRADLAALTGAQNVGGAQVTVSSFAELRALSTGKASTWATISNPQFVNHYRLDLSDNTTADDGGSVLVPNNGAGRWKLNHNGIVTLAQFSCVATPGTNNAAQLAKAIQYCAANHVQMGIGPGTYEYSGTLDFGYPGLVVRGSGFRSSVLKCTSIGRAVDALGGRPNNGAFSFDIDLSDFTIEGNSATTDLFRCRINHPRLRDINVREASPINGCGFRFEGPVLGKFENLTCSTNTQLMANRPQNGFMLDADPTDIRRATANTFTNLTIEGMTGDGIILVAADANVFLGGSGENSGGGGITVRAGCQMNTFITVDCEHNSGYADIYDSGQSSTYIGCGTTKNFYIDNSSLMCKVEGGWHDKFEVGVGAAYPEISRVKVRFFGGAVGLVSNTNPTLSVKQMYDVQASAFLFPAKPVTTIAVTTGTFTYTNNNAFDEWITVVGGTVSQINLNRGAVAGAAALPTSGMFHIQPGDGLTFVSTGAPTVRRVPGGANFG